MLCLMVLWLGLSAGSAHAAGPLLLMSPGGGNLDIQLPAAAASSVTVGATPFAVKVPAGATVTFTVTRPGQTIAQSAPVKLKGQLAGEGVRSAVFTYTDLAGTGVDTITAVLRAKGRTLAEGTTAITWAPPEPCTDIGLPALIRSLGCSKALHFISIAYDTGGCLSSFAAAGRLVDALKAADNGGDVLRAAGHNNPLADLAEAVSELRKDGVSVTRLIKSLDGVRSSGDLISGLWTTIKTVADDPAAATELTAIASDLAHLVAGPCIDLVEDSSTPAVYQVPLSQLCQNDGVEIDAVNGCPYDGSTGVSSGMFGYTILIESNNDSVTPQFYDLIDFPATTCSSITLSFALPTDGSSPGTRPRSRSPANPDPPNRRRSTTGRSRPLPPASTAEHGPWRTPRPPRMTRSRSTATRPAPHPAVTDPTLAVG